MPVYYSTFQIKNTTYFPITLSVCDPDGNVITVGTLKPGQESLQVAPYGTTWNITPPDNDPGMMLDLPVPTNQATIVPDHLGMESNNDTNPQFMGNLDKSSSIPYEAHLKLETGSHSARINQLLVTPDEKSLITSSEDKTIRIWDVENETPAGLLLGQIGDGDEGRIQAIAMDPSGKYILAIVWVYPDSHDQAGRESDLRVFERATGNLQACLHYPGTLYDLDFSPDGTYLALICNPKYFDFDRRGYVCLHEAQEILQGFGTLPPAREIYMREIYTSYSWNIVMPAFVRFIPEEKGPSNTYRIAVASWIYNLGVQEEGEYTGRIYWYDFSSNGLNEIQSCDTPEIVREDPPGVHCIRPDSLAVSREFVITTSENRDIKEFFCHDHHGQLVARVLSETVPTNPAFSKDGSLLIVGQKDESAVVQIKVYHTSGGQFNLKSTYYGHTADTRAVALLQNGTAVTAGGDQFSIHFWSPVHAEGEQTAILRGTGRNARAVGINEQEQIGIGTHSNIVLNDGRITFQRIFDLRSLTLRPLSVSEYTSASFQRSQTTKGENTLSFGRRGPNWNLFLDPASLSLIQGDWYYPTTFGFTPTGTIITGADDGRVRVVAYDRGEWYMRADRTLIGHTGRVLDHAASTKWLVTCGKDQVIRLWYMEDVEHGETNVLEPALNLFVGMDDEWVIWSKSGYYTASQNGDRYLGFHINRGPYREALFYSSDRFHSVFLRPDIIQSILIHGSEERAAQADPRISIRSVNVADILPPIIELDENGVKIFESADKKAGFVEFNLAVEAHGKPITRLCVLRNGRLVHVERSVPTYGKITLPQLSLLPGENRFKIFAENKDVEAHTIKSNPIEHTIFGKGRYENEADVKNGMLYVLAIGVSKGAHLKDPASGDKTGPFELSFAHMDAEAVLNAFTNNKAFEGVKTTLLVNEQATKENILSAVREIEQNITLERDPDRGNVRDVLLVYLSGHGVYRIVNQQLYFWNYDFDLDDPGGTGLAFTDLGEMISRLPVEVILMTDACHSGMAGSDVVKGIDPNELAKRIYGDNETDMYIFNAARRSESALEGKSVKHGYFTKAILDALTESPDPVVTMIRLIDQVQWRVQQYTKNAQNPVCRMYGDLLPLEVYKK